MRLYDSFWRLCFFSFQQTFATERHATNDREISDPPAQRRIGFSRCALSFAACLLPLLLIGWTLCNAPAVAQSAYPFVQNDIGAPGAAGAYSAGPPTFQVDGAGTGITGSVDHFTYVNTPASTANIEIRAKVSSLAPIPPNVTYSNYATAGLMVRNSTMANSPHAFVSVSPANGINFTTRNQSGAVSTTTLGPSIAAPVWLRLVVSGTSVAGYYTSDPNGISNWTLVGKTCLSGR
jgi:hypothetical protein